MPFLSITAIIVIIQCLTGFDASHSLPNVTKDSFDKLTFTKVLLNTKPVPNVAFKENVGFPAVQYPSSIHDFNKSPQYYHNTGYSVAAIETNKINKTQRSTCEDILENYKRKQRLQNMNLSMKKMFNKTLAFDDYEIPINVSQNIPKKMIKIQDELIISKYINKKPYNFCEYDINYDPETTGKSKLQNQIIIDKFINKKPYMSPEAKRQEQFRKYSNLLGIVDDLIAICEHIFNGIVAYVYENYGDFILVPFKEANEILEIVDKLKQVLDILDFLSANIVLEYIELSKENTNNTISNSKEVNIATDNETVAVYSSPTINIVDEAIGTIELILKSALPNTNSTETKPEETKAIISRLDSLKNILGTLEQMAVNETLSSEKSDSDVVQKRNAK